MKNRSLCASLFIAAALAAGLANAAAPVVVDGVLTGNAGMTLYTFDKDTAGSGKSVCNGPCAANWPPFLASADDAPGGAFTLVGRDDGGRQWAVKGKPLYHWAKDQKPGDMSGDGVNGLWHVAKP